MVLAGGRRARGGGPRLAGPTRRTPSTRLSEHIHDVELTASASLGRIRVDIEPVDVASLCQELDGSPGVRSGADLTVNADPRLLSRVLRDLWATAHHEPVPDNVAIDVVETGAWHEIRVVREGNPISPTGHPGTDRPVRRERRRDRRDHRPVHGPGPDRGSWGLPRGRGRRRPAPCSSHGCHVNQRPIRSHQGPDRATRGRKSMKYTLSCGDAMPGCSARFEEDSRERILELVADTPARHTASPTSPPRCSRRSGPTSCPPEADSADTARRSTAECRPAPH